jgi:hypothetical protein
MAEVSFSMDVGELRVSAAQLGPRLNRAISGYMLANSQRVQNYARSNAPWTDRTGNARQGLFATYSGDGEGRHAIDLFHSVPYGIWLEVRFAGRFSIIRPTIEAEGHRIMAGLRDLIERMS